MVLLEGHCGIQTIFRFGELPGSTPDLLGKSRLMPLQNSTLKMAVSNFNLKTAEYEYY